MYEPRRRHRSVFPYYKVQVFKEAVNAWKDEQRAFDTIEDAQDYIKRKVAPRVARIMVVESQRRYVLAK
jgi:hypothetical protein